MFEAVFTRDTLSSRWEMSKALWNHPISGSFGTDDETANYGAVFILRWLRLQEVMPQQDTERRSSVTLDVSKVASVLELHKQLAESLEFPNFYGKNWDAFWDSITSLVAMPHRLVITGWSNVESRFPKDAQIMLDCLRDLNEQYPSWSCQVELNT